MGQSWQYYKSYTLTLHVNICSSFERSHAGRPLLISDYSDTVRYIEFIGAFRIFLVGTWEVAFTRKSLIATWPLNTSILMGAPACLAASPFASACDRVR